MDQCKWPGCIVPLAYGGRGRPPEYCPEHARASRKRTDKARPDRRTRKSYDACCLDAQAAKVRAYGGGALVKAANVRTCAQHQQYRAWYGLSRKRYLAQSSELRDEDNSAQVTEIRQSQAYRITVNHPDDYLVPDPSMEIEQPPEFVRGHWWPAVKSGYDAEVEAMTRRYLASAPNGREPNDGVVIAEVAPVSDIGNWLDRCAEGRRWHKTEAFGYPPEMNRGAGWCA